MNFILLLISAIVLFFLFTIARRVNDVFILIAVAIGCAVNANLFTPLSHPITLGKLIFAPDSILYTLFIFTIIIRAIDYSIKDAKTMTITAVIAIVISAVIELFATISFNGKMELEYLITFGKYLFSAIGTIAGVWLMLLVYQKLKDKKVNVYAIIYIGILVACLINSNIYYGFVALSRLRFIENSFYLLLGSFIGKIFCVHLAFLSYYAYHKWLKKNN